MKCIDCGGVLEIRKENRNLKSFGLPKVKVLGVEVRRCKDCGDEEIALPHVEELLQLVARAIIRQPRRLSAAEIRFLRKHLGWSGTVA